MKTGKFQQIALFALAAFVAFTAGQIGHASVLQAPPSASTATPPGNCEWHNGVLSLQISPDSKYLLGALDEGTVRLWDLKSAALIRTFSVASSNPFAKAVFSPDGKYVLASVDQTPDAKDGIAVLWDTNTGQQVHTFSAGKGDNDLLNEGPLAAFLPDGKHIVGSYTDEAVLWETESGKLVQSFPSESAPILEAQISPDGNRILTQGYPVVVWDVNTGNMLHNFGRVPPDTLSVFSPMEKYILTRSIDMNSQNWALHIWDAQTFTLVKTLGGDEDLDGFFSLDDQYVVTSDLNSTYKVWNVRTGQKLHTFERYGLQINALVPSRPNLYILAASDGHTNTILHLWDLQANKELYSLT
ncbi:MAG TPA: hypothetical protein VKQ72_10605, partial [Aggregatilineales bacterium]|nr:hypothetical protein [Aggregatilineales bacterium]